MSISDRIRERLAALSIKQREAARRADMPESTLRNILSGTSESPRGITLNKLVAALETTERWLLTGEHDDAPRTKGQPIHYIPGEEVVLTGREQLLPVYSGAAAGLGKIIVSPDIVDRVAMPAALKDVKNAYGIMVDGESMVPVFDPGDIAWVNPHLRPMRGKNHVFYHTPPLGEDAEAIIKRLDGWNDREWDLWQWQPATSFKESRKIWPICHRVVGKYDAS
jgi:phage repressor protein C with HTH and peptisase S24 domain